MQEFQRLGPRTTLVQMALVVQLTGVLSRRATLAIGGVRVHLASADAELALDVPPSVAHFASGDDRPDATIEARWAVIEPAAPSPVVFDSGGVWRLSQAAGELLFEFRSPLFGSIPYKSARFRPDFSAGEVMLHRPYFGAASRVYPLEYPLDELVFTSLLARRNGVELHGCGIADGDAGLLFLGFSGAGKSTMARLWRGRSGVTVLSDDRIILRPGGGRVLMHGTPWHGDEALIEKGPVALSRIFILHQGPECAIRPLRRSAAIAGMFARCFAPFYSADALAGTVAALEQTVRLVPCMDLWFTPDAAAIDFIRAIR